MNSKVLYQLAFQAIELPASLIVGGRLVSEFRRACGDETEFRCWLLYEMSFALQGYFLTRHRPNALGCCRLVAGYLGLSGRHMRGLE